jgi:hypothetical protein
MEINNQKIKRTYFARKTDSVQFNYYVSDVLILCTDRTKNLDVSKLYFLCYVEFVYTQALRTSGLIHYFKCNFSSLDSLIFYILVTF